MLFDTHAHLNFSAFDGKVSSVITDSKKAGVGNITVPGTDIESSRKAVEIAEKYDGVYAAVGIHPHHAFEYVEQKKNSVDQDIKELKKILDHDSSLYILHSTFHIVAIGEVGLDRYEYKKTKYKDYKIGEEFIDLQKELLIAQLALAKKYKLSVIVHNREAKGDMLSLLDKRWDSYFERRMVFHCCEPDAEIL
ncbi:MAG: TatD family hydrolase, partial [Candidatus Paceibacterota bacterium]